MKKQLFTRGFEETRKKVLSNPYYIRSCFNCIYYYKIPFDEEEMCQNSDVISYDMLITNNNICCLKWTPIKNDKDTSIFHKKTGRSILD